MPEITVASYNIRHAMGIDLSVNLDRIVQVLKNIDADVILLQEVDMSRPRSGQEKQVNYLASALNMNYAYGMVNRFKQGSYGNAILSVYPILLQHNYRLKAERHPRCCIEIILIIEGTKVHILNTHLGLDHDERLKNVQTISSIISALYFPCILGGDFNCRPHSMEVQILIQSLKDSFEMNTGPPYATFPANKAWARIDYILYNHLCICTDFYISESTASDHLPVIAKFRI